MFLEPAAYYDFRRDLRFRETQSEYMLRHMQRDQDQLSPGRALAENIIRKIVLPILAVGDAFQLVWAGITESLDQLAITPLAQACFSKAGRYLILSICALVGTFLSTKFVMGVGRLLLPGQFRYHQGESVMFKILMSTVTVVWGGVLMYRTLSSQDKARVAHHFRNLTSSIGELSSRLSGLNFKELFGRMQSTFAWSFSNIRETASSFASRFAFSGKAAQSAADSSQPLLAAPAPSEPTCSRPFFYHS